MGGKDDGGSLFLQAQDLLADQFRIHGVEAAEGLVQDHEGRPVHHRGDELDLLGHTLGEFLHFLVPPVLDLEADEPLLQFHGGLAGAHSLELGQVHGLVSYLHLAVQATFLGKVADAGHILFRNGMALEVNLTAGGDGNAVDDADQGGFTRTIRAQQAEDLTLGDFQRHIVQCHLGAKVLCYVLYFNDCHCS